MGAGPAGLEAPGATDGLSVELRYPRLVEGSSGVAVEHLQRQLQHWGLLTPWDVDGHFGPRTSAALRRFQERRPPGQTRFAAVDGLPVSGVADRDTWAELLRRPAAALEAAPTGAGAAAPVELVSRAQAEAVFGRPVAAHQLADLNAALWRYGITTPARIRHFLAQVDHESGGLRWMKELASGWDYEDRRDLGNREPGDGPRYKGAGALQLTGRANYQQLAQELGDPRVMEGVDYVSTTYPFTSAAHWWQRNRMNQRVDAGADARQISRWVNGRDPANGLSDRLASYSRAVRAIPDGPAGVAGAGVQKA